MDWTLHFNEDNLGCNLVGRSRGSLRAAPEAAGEIYFMGARAEAMVSAGDTTFQFMATRGDSNLHTRQNSRNAIFPGPGSNL